MDNVGVVEATQYVDNGITFAYIGKELVSKSLALAGTLYKTCNIHYVAYCRDNASGMYYLGKLGQAFVGYTDLTYLRIYSAEGEICRLCLGTAQTIK